MNWPIRDDYGRTTKLLVDSGRAASPAEAEKILAGYVLQVTVAARDGFGETGQAALLTAVNAGHRAFKGGVLVIVDDESAEMTLAWARGKSVRDAVQDFGGQIVSEIDPKLPTIVIGRAKPFEITAPVLYLSWSGWVAAATRSTSSSLSGGAISLTGVVAAGLGVSEMFQHCQGSNIAGLRDVGLSLWEPGSDWRHPSSHAADLIYLPKSLWVLGLGHLGQGSIWSLGCLPYPSSAQPSLHLMDTDTFVSANLDTGLLARSSSIDVKKTRVVTSRLRAIGIDTFLVERLFDESLQPTPDEPLVAFAGFDNPDARRLVEQSFPMTIDAGLGAGPQDYLDILIHTFPGDIKSGDAFPERSRRSAPRLPDAYEDEIQRQVDAGIPEGDARCGLVEAAGATVGAAFVGAVAGALTVADALRQLHDGPRYSVVALNLSEPEFVSAARTVSEVPVLNPGFVDLRRLGGA